MLVLTVNLCRRIANQIFAVAAVTVIVVLARPACAQLDHQREPVLYGQTTATDRVARLMAQLHSGEAELTWQTEHGYLRSLLDLLDVPIESQSLVFSKTSLQISKISPETPRAVYFCDDVYVGWVPDGELIEISAADPQLGGVFYTLKQSSAGPPLLQRETDRCMTCHASTHTRRVPGHFVRSVYCNSRGQPLMQLGSHITDDRSPLGERWGGWYVTGSSGQQPHLGNRCVADAAPNDSTDAAQNLSQPLELDRLVNTARYLSPHSDIVALMVLEHQTRVHNVLTAANHRVRIAQLDATRTNGLLNRPAEYISESTAHRFDTAAESVVQALLMCDSIQLSDAITGSNKFAEQFGSRGPTDQRGRRLRHLDLQHRLFRYPCSYLIYSESFKQLPEVVKSRILARLAAVLSGHDQRPEYAHLSAADRQAILEILTDTGIELPAPVPAKVD